MALRTLPEAAVYQGQGEKGEVLPRNRYKETRILLSNTSAFFWVGDKIKYDEVILMFFFSIVCFLLQYEL